MPTIKLPRTAILGVVHALKTLDLSDATVNSVTWCHGIARNIKLTAALAKEWSAKLDEINSEAYSKYMEAKEAAKDDVEALTRLDAEYAEVLEDRERLIKAGDAWLAEEVDQEIYAWPIDAIPTTLDRRIVLALSEWIRD